MLEEVLSPARHRILVAGAAAGSASVASLAEAPVITVPAITLEGDANGAPHPEAATYRGWFSARYAHRVFGGGSGHNRSREAPQAFAQAILDSGGFTTIGQQQSRFQP